MSSGCHDPTEPAIPPDLLRAHRFALRRYGNYPNVAGVLIGPAVRDGEPGPLSIQFLVTRKGRRWFRPPGRLPSFVHGRNRDGSVRLSSRYPTDVLETGAVEAVCGSGSPIEGPGTRGSITLLFGNKAPGDAGNYLITCAHATGDIFTSPPAATELESECSPAAVLARTVFSASVLPDRTLEFDVALARIDPAALPLPDLTLVEGERIETLEEVTYGFASVLAATSGDQMGDVLSMGGACDVDYSGGTLRLGNLCMLRGIQIAPGDSGGLVYRERAALGMLVARSSRGFAFFHPLTATLEWLREQNPSLDIRPFPTRRPAGS